ncbi:MAG: LytR C-terminal domain-containing protein [Aeromicrobium erythreum]
MTHRRTPSRSILVLPGWFFVLSAVLCVAAAAWLAVVALDGGSDDPDPVARATPSATTPSPTATTPSPSATTPSPSPSPSPTPSPTPTVDRSSIGVSVLNGTRTPGLARRSVAAVQRAGWTVAGVGNWRGAVATSTVFYPAGREAEARQLARDLDVDAVAPAVAGMRSDRLTVVLLAVR